MRLSLNEALILSSKSNIALKQSKENILVKDYSVASNSASFLPEVGITAVAATRRDREPYYGESEVPLTGRDHNFYKGEIYLEWNLFRGFKDQNLLNSKKSELEIARVTYVELSAQTARDVIEKYFEIQMLNIQLSALKEAQASRQKQFNDIKNRIKVGRSTKLELLEAEYKFKQKQPEIIAAQADIKKATLDLLRLMGASVNQKLILLDPLKSAHRTILKEPLPEMSKLLESAFLQNPKLKRLVLESEKTSFELSQTGAGHWPTLDFRLATGTQAFLREQVGEAPARTFEGQIVLTVPVFNGGRAFTDALGRKSKLTESRLEEAKYRQELLSLLHSGYTDYEVAKSQHLIAKDNIAVAEATISQAENLYRSGRATLTTVLDAYSKKAEAVSSEAEAIFKQIKSTILIKSLLGTLRLVKTEEL